MTESELSAIVGKGRIVRPTSESAGQDGPIAVLPGDGRGATAFRQSRILQPAWRSALRQLTLASADVFAVLLAAVAAGWFSGSSTESVALLATLPLWIVVAKVQGLYDADEIKTWHLTTDELPRIFYFVTVAVVLSLIVMSLFGADGLGVGGAMAVWATALLSDTAFRAGARAAWRHFVPRERSIVIGGRRSAARVMRKLELERGHHCVIVGQIPHSAPLSASVVRALITSTFAHRVILAVDDLDDPSLAEVAAICREAAIKLSVIPALSSVLSSVSRVYHVAEMPLVEIPTSPASPMTIVAKRAMDIMLSGIMLAVAVPLFVVVAVAVRLDSPGAVLYRQKRAGRGGVPFTMIKFRSMCANADSQLKNVVDLDALKSPMFKLTADPRVTRVGRFLRTSSLDELPQLWNVLRGDMSLVGPRPEELQIVARYDANARAIRLAMKPGLTGPMQVHGRSQLTFEERLEIERNYVEHYSLGRDLVILARTLEVVLFRRGAC